MKTLTTKNLETSLDDLITQVVTDSEATLISGCNGQKAVLVPYNEFSSWRETEYLLSHPANVDHLRKSIADAKAGRLVSHELIEP